MQKPEQEIIAIVDESNRVIGEAPRHIMRRDNLIHRAAYILVFNEREELFVQKRSLSKDIYPGLWDVAAGGVVLSGESYLESAVREIQEELGVTNPQLRHHFNYFFNKPDNRVWGAVFTCCHSGPFVLQKEEIDDGRFLPLTALDELNKKEPFTPDGLLVLKRLQNTRDITEC
ncbi:MAG: NUDIX hydrolase [Desulfobacterales bacterium]|nr:MAG: NUDIX hydrolase [Desulfobacterales bacterium]